MRKVPKPWGYELIWAETGRYVGKVLHIEAGHRLSRQFHNVKDETFLVQKGEMSLEIGQGEDVQTSASKKHHKQFSMSHTSTADSHGRGQAVETAAPQAHLAAWNRGR